VTITFDPSCIGQHARVARDRKAAAVADTVVTETAWEVSLEPGFYAVLVDALNLAVVFEAAGGAHVTVK